MPSRPTRHRDERREPRLRAAGLRRARRSTPFSQVTNGFAGTASDGLDPARRVARADRRIRTRRRQHRPDGRVPLGAGKRVHRRPRLRREPGRGRAAAEGSLAADVRRARAPLRARLAAYDALSVAAARLPGTLRRDRRRWSDEYYAQRERAQGVRGQDLPRRDRREPRSPWGQAVSAGDPRTRTSAPTARCSRATSTRHGPGCSPTATCRPRETRSASCSSASSSPTARCRATASSTASPRRTRSAPSSTRPRTRS